MTGSHGSEVLHLRSEAGRRTLVVGRERTLYVVCHPAASVALHIYLEPEAACVLTTHTPDLLDLNVELAKNSSFTATVAAAGASAQRLKVALKEEGASADICGLLLVPKQRVTQLTVSIDQGAAKTKARQLFKSLVSDGGQASVKSHCRIGAQAFGACSYVSSRMLTLGSRAGTLNSPSFEIFSDDVTATHGATTQALDPEMLFYLTSRGVSSLDAQRLLIEGFCSELLQKCSLLGALELFLREELR